MSRQELRRGKRIVILCEGATESYAVEGFIHKQWKEDGFSEVGLQAIDLRGKLEDVHVRVPLHLRDGKVLAVFTLVDLHEMKRVRLPAITDLQTRVAAAQQWLNDEFDNSVRGRFYPPFLFTKWKLGFWPKGKPWLVGCTTLVSLPNQTRRRRMI